MELSENVRTLPILFAGKYGKCPSYIFTEALPGDDALEKDTECGT
jgi:hypothetical protein